MNHQCSTTALWRQLTISEECEDFGKEPLASVAGNTIFFTHCHIL